MTVKIIQHNPEKVTIIDCVKADYMTLSQKQEDGDMIKPQDKIILAISRDGVSADFSFEFEAPTEIYFMEKGKTIDSICLN